MEVKTIAVDRLHPNSYNPNVVDENIMEQLEVSIKRDGVQQPIIVRKSKTEEGKFEIIDGEHRWLTAKQLELTEVPYTVQDISDAEAMVMTINMNKLRGEFDTIKLAELLKNLQETYTAEELQGLVGYSIEEIASYNDLLTFDPKDLADDGDDLKGAISLSEQQEQLPNIFELSLSLEQLEIVEAAINFRVKDDRAKGLTAVCRDYLLTSAPDKYKEIQERMRKLNAKVVQEEVEVPSKEIPVESIDKNTNKE